KKLLLAAEIVIEHAIHGARPPADPLNARAAEAMACEFVGCGLQDLALHALRIALAAPCHALACVGLSLTPCRARFGSGHVCDFSARAGGACPKRPSIGRHPGALPSSS